MEHWKEMGEALGRYIRPATFPIAVKMCRGIDAFPENTRRPKRDLGVQIRLCQGITMCRKYGWTVGMTPDDIWCVIASVAYGWYETEDEMFLGDRFLKMNYAKNEDAARKQSQYLMDSGFKKGQYAGLVLSPLERTTIDPDAVMVYCNPAQLMRLIHAANYAEGKAITSVFTGRAASCTEGIIQTIKSGEPKVIVPGNGDRVWAMTQDDEMLFTMPSGQLQGIIEGLEGTHRGGIRYPIPVDIRHEPTLPPQLKEVDGRIKQEEGLG
jgi:uncharacterized protein (DUF169 family)